MSRFFVGQRVRLARPFYPRNFGIVGRVLEFSNFPAGTRFLDGRIFTDCDCRVVWDGDDLPCAQHTSQLEPILPEGHKPSEYSFEGLMDHLREVTA